MEKKLVIITPAKNEEIHIHHTINSVLRQLHKPVKWLIIDDGSTDNTVEIVNNYIKDFSWIKLIKKNTRGKRAPGANVINAFNYGLSNLTGDWDFIVKLDADLEFEDNYFEKLLSEFEKDSRLGIAGGYIVNLVDGKKQKIDNTPEYHVRGATKVYRKECFNDIGGLMPKMGWDGIDEIKAMMFGWKTKSFKELLVLHHRPTGKETGMLRYAWRWGKSNYYMGYNPLFLMLSCIKRFTRKPYVLFGLTIYLGFIYSYITRKEQISDRNFIKFIRKFQSDRIKGLKLV